MDLWNAASDHWLIPLSGSGVMFVEWIVPKGVASGRPPNGAPSWLVWQT